MSTSYLGIYLLVGAFFATGVGVAYYRSRGNHETWSDLIGWSLLGGLWWPATLVVTLCNVFDRPLPKRREKE